MTVLRIYDEEMAVRVKGGRMWTMLETLMIKGGPVMWPLAAMSMAGLTIAIREAGTFAVFSRSFDAGRLLGILETLAKGDKDIPQDLLNGPDPVSRWYAKRLNDVASPAVSGLDPEDIVETGLSSLSALATITAAAPLLGILGTVLGIIQSFSALGDAAAIHEVSAGIGQALVSTAAGLVVAMAALLPHNILSVYHARWTHATLVWARRLERVIEHSGRRV